MRLAGLLLAGLACLASTAPASPPRQVAVVAHRGLSDGMPENTLAAFRHAVDRGFEIIELDVRATRDGHLVILHDVTLDRTTDCSGLLADLSFARIKSCDAGWPSHPGEHIPTLDEALDFARDRPVRLLLDIKPGTPIPLVLKAVRDRHAEAKVILGLRQIDDVARARTASPAVKILAFMSNLSDARAFATAGATILRLWSEWVETDPETVGLTRSLGTQVWIMVGRKLPKGDKDWRALHSRMIATGAEGLITNRPELIATP